MKDMFLLGTARLASTRLPNKMLLPIGGKSLMEIYCEKIKLLENQFSGSGIALWKGDIQLIEIAEKVGVNIIPRNKESVTGLRSRNEELHFLEDIKQDVILWLNGCQPFLNPTTVLCAADVFIEQQCWSMTSVVQEYNWFWDKEGNPINNTDPTQVSTQNSPPIFRSCHSFHIFRRQEMIEHSRYWGFRNNKDPMLFIMENPNEVIDIDTEQDYLMASSMGLSQSAKI